MDRPVAETATTPAAPRDASTPVPPAALATSEAHTLPRDTTPVWQSELILSGGLVFALIQLEGWLSQGFYGAIAQLGVRWGSLVGFGYVIVRVLVLSLVVTFVVHLMLRALWVAVLGLRSVYPQGILWDRLRMGPVMLQFARNRVYPIGTLIDRLDNLGSVVFSGGMTLVVMTLFSIPLTLASLVLAHALDYLAFDGTRFTLAFSITLGLLVLPATLASLADRHFGSRLTPGGRAARLIALTMRGSLLLIPMRLVNTMTYIVTSNVGSVRGIAIFLGIIYTLMGFVSLQTAVQRGAVSLDEVRYLPTRMEGAETLDPRHYASRRQAQFLHATTPFIPDPVVDGKRLRLFVPYSPERHSAALARTCPTLAEDAVRDIPAETERRRELIACFTTVLAPAIDGRALEDPGFAIAVDPASGLRGLEAYVPVEDLASGRHELTVVRLPRSDAAPGDRPEEPVYRILFWR